MKYIYENKQYSSLDKVFKELLEKCPDTIIICKKCEGKGEIQYSETNWRNEGTKGFVVSTWYDRVEFLGMQDPIWQNQCAKLILCQ